MQRRLYALLMTAMLLFAPLKGITAAQPSELPDNTVIQFPDPNFEAEVRRIIGKPMGDIMRSDVSGITKLDISFLYISDLTGLEYFAALKEFSCGMMELKTLDVSRNPALEVLYCNENDLTVLDLSHNPALKKLFCTRNYELMELNVSENSALEILFCADNKLKALDVSNNPALRELSCRGNLLLTLDLSQNPALEELDCSNNHLTMLNIIQNPMLRSIRCNNNFFPDRSAVQGLDESKLDTFSFDPQGRQD